MARPRYDRPTDAEIQILCVLWDSPDGCTVRDVFKVMTKLRGSGYNSSLKLIQIMCDKGLVRRDDSVRPQRYTAASSRKAVRRLMLKDLLTRVFGGDARELLLSLEQINRELRPCNRLPAAVAR